MVEDNISEEQAQEIVRQFAEAKENTQSFFSKVIKAEDTTRTGNLSEEELGVSQLPVRTYEELALFCRDICEDDSFGSYFDKMSEIQTATSLSKNALLLKLVVTQKKELADLTPKKKVKKGFFKGKEKKEEEE